MKFENSIKKNQILINFLKDSIEDNDLKDLIQCVEGDFTIYSGTYAQLRPIRFLFHLIKSFFFISKYELNINNNKIKSDHKISTVITTNHLYKENLEPLINKLLNRNFSVSHLRINYLNAFSLARFLKFKRNTFSIINFFIKNTSLINYNNLIYLIYIKYVMLINAKRLVKFLKKNMPDDSKLYLSAEVCDIFSRSAALACKYNKKKFFLFQCGPLSIDTNLEIDSILCDEFIAWQSSKEFFKKKNNLNKINIKKVSYFQPLRFLKQNETKEVIYDIVIFLTWLNFSSPTESINNQLNLILKHLKKRDMISIFLKMHPHTDKSQEKYLFDNYSDYDFISNDENAIDIINKSKMVFNFGSTICFDSNNANVKTGLINFDNHISSDHDFFKLPAVKNIQSLEDLDFFVDDFEIETNQISKKDFRLVDYIEKASYLNS
tara:strand:+ start:801 stop:2105 length:1305 start_codon:yes stop_codon:yes gene_type:complete